jgi:hypothetical protein
MQPFFPTYKEQFTKTPNIFFDKILTDPKVTLNQVRLVGYLIRQTIGYNKEAKWAAVSRKELIGNAGIPNGRIKEAIDGCLKNDWILIYETGENGKQERYIFLNDPLNQRIVYGLKKGYFTVSDLKYLNLAGIEHLLKKHNIPTDIKEENIHSSTETGEGNTRTPTETVEGGSTETVEGTPTETVEGDKGKPQEGQGQKQPLNTSFKDNLLKTFDDDGSAGTPTSWETDLRYAAFRLIFTEAGADDIILHDKHYPKYLKAVNEAGYTDLLKYAEEYIKEHGAKAQICLFIGGEWKKVRTNLQKNQNKKKKEEKLPKAVEAAENRQAQPAQPQPQDEESLEAKQARIRAKLKLMNERLENNRPVCDPNHQEIALQNGF